MKVLVTGSSGMIGSALIESLKAKGHEAVRLPRKMGVKGSPFWDPENGIINLADAGDIDAVVNLSGDNLAAGRWNDQKKARILNSRVKGTRLLAEFFAASKNKPEIIVSASAIGIYGDRGEEQIDETGEPGIGFLANVAMQWEAAMAPAVDAGIRVVNARFGLVLSSTGGILKKMLLPFRMGFGGVLGDGKQYITWVCIDDLVGMIQYVIASESLRGPVNFVSPHPVTNREFTKTLGQVLHRPTILAMPAFAVRLAFGEKANALLLSSTRAVPGKLLDSGYAFSYPELRGALEHLLT